MAAWTVVHSSDFIEDIKRFHAYFKERCDHALQTESPNEAARIDPPSREFDDFTQAVLELSDGKSDPADVLKFCRADKDGMPLFSLVCGRWRGLYRVDKIKKVCDAISVDEMNRFARYAERFRRPFRKSI